MSMHKSKDSYGETHLIDISCLCKCEHLEKYDISETGLGRGTFGDVFELCNKDTHICDKVIKVIILSRSNVIEFNKYYKEMYNTKMKMNEEAFRKLYSVKNTLDLDVEKCARSSAFRKKQLYTNNYFLHRHI